MSRRALNFSQFIIESQESQEAREIKIESSSRELKLGSGNTGGGLEFAVSSWQGVNWPHAKQLAAEFGTGWRLPTQEEWEYWGDTWADGYWIYPDTKYWSSTELNVKFSWYYCQQEPFVAIKSNKANLYSAVFIRNSNSVPAGTIRLVQI